VKRRPSIQQGFYHVQHPPEEGVVTQHQIRGFPVRVTNTRPDIELSEVLGRLAQALDLVASFAPHRFRHMRGDLAAIVVRRFPCRGAYFPQSRECLVELTFTVNPAHGVGEIAASIVHEATHARIAHRCGSLPEQLRPREERICRRAELEFGLALPDGAVVLERARRSLAMTDTDVAPVIDWTEAARRVAGVDARARPES
jgi:hypothetical protein